MSKKGRASVDNDVIDEQYMDCSVILKGEGVGIWGNTFLKKSSFPKQF